MLQKRICLLENLVIVIVEQESGFNHNKMGIT